MLLFSVEYAHSWLVVGTKFFCRLFNNSNNVTVLTFLN